MESPPEAVLLASALAERIDTTLVNIDGTYTCIDILAYLGEESVWTSLSFAP